MGVLSSVVKLQLATSGRKRRLSEVPPIKRTHVLPLRNCRVLMATINIKIGMPWRRVAHNDATLMSCSHLD